MTPACLPVACFDSNLVVWGRVSVRAGLGVLESSGGGRCCLTRARVPPAAALAAPVHAVLLAVARMGCCRTGVTVSTGKDVPGGFPMLMKEGRCGRIWWAGLGVLVAFRQLQTGLAAMAPVACVQSRFGLRAQFAGGGGRV